MMEEGSQFSEWFLQSLLPFLDPASTDVLLRTSKTHYVAIAQLLNIDGNLRITVQNYFEGNCPKALACAVWKWVMFYKAKLCHLFPTLCLSPIIKSTIPKEKSWKTFQHYLWTGGKFTVNDVLDQAPDALYHSGSLLGYAFNEMLFHEEKERRHDNREDLYEFMKDATIAYAEDAMCDSSDMFFRCMSSGYEYVVCFGISFGMIAAYSAMLRRLFETKNTNEFLKIVINTPLYDPIRHVDRWVIICECLEEFSYPCINLEEYSEPAATQEEIDVHYKEVKETIGLLEWCIPHVSQTSITWFREIIQKYHQEADEYYQNYKPSKRRR